MPPYAGYSTPVSVTTYNCAGLSHRTYDYKSYADTAALDAAGTSATSCRPGQVKHWLWKYDIHLEDSSGRRTPSDWDFHTVAGVADSAGNDPTDVYSKNGARPVFGPGTGPSFRPAAREQARDNDPSNRPSTDAQGRPIYKVRQNIVEHTFCLQCASQTAPTQGPPARP